MASDIEAGIKRVLVSYDIGCQWGTKLQKRLETYAPPLSLNLQELSRWCVAIPKFHLVGHGVSCQVPFNLALMDGVGLTHGEGVETIWSNSTSLATWSWENGPGARHLALDNHWGGWNWRKLVNSHKIPHAMVVCQFSGYFIGDHLKKMLERAWKWSKSQRAVATSLGEAVSPQTLTVWQKMVDNYHANPSSPNPFTESEISTFFLSIHVFVGTEDPQLARWTLSDDSYSRKKLTLTRLAQPISTTRPQHCSCGVL